MALEIGQRNSTHVIARVKFHFYVRLQFLRTSTPDLKTILFYRKMPAVISPGRKQLYNNLDRISHTPSISEQTSVYILYSEYNNFSHELRNDSSIYVMFWTFLLYAVFFSKTWLLIVCYDGKSIFT